MVARKGPRPWLLGVGFEVFVEEVEQECFGLFWGDAFEAVACAFKGDEFGFDGGGFEFVHEPGGLFDGDVFICGAVKAEGGGGIGGDPVEGAADDVFFALGAEVATKEEGEDVFGIHAFVVTFGEVTGAEEVDDATDGAALI